MDDAPKLFKTEDGNFVRFRYDTKKNNFQSESQGRPVFDKVLIMTIVSPGQQRSEVERVAISWDQEGKEKRDTASFQRYGSLIDKFVKEEMAGDLQGTPIEQWKEIDITRAATMRSLNIYTVEALADLGDTGLQAIGMDGRELQKKAKAYIEATKDSAGVIAKMKEAQAENVALNARLLEMQERLEALENGAEEDTPKRGKRKKA